MDRNTIDEKYKWDLTQIFKSTEEFEECYKKAENLIEDFKKYENIMGENAKKIYEKIGSNVSMNYDYEIKYDVNGQLRDAKDLSDGERTIMMLALRFAVLDSMYKNHDSVIILDDPFDSLDSIKLKKAVNLIKELANDWQIVYFTCHNSRMIE